MSLNSTAACLLGLLDIGPPPPGRQRWEADRTMSGTETWNAVKRSVGGFWSMTRSQVYAELKKLVAEDLVSESAPGRYSITPAGEDTVQAWFRDFALAEPRDDQVRSPFTLTVFFGHYLAPDTLERVVRENRLRLERRLEALRLIEASLGGEDRSLPGSTLRRALLNATSAVDWADDVLRRLHDTKRAGDARR
ncbi:MAG TPA: PadR family transcriptional regulator [Acidimicrobiales bacterium]|nr:PadR family transcriptional regulator [Acidimicrobiales bacterium]